MILVDTSAWIAFTRNAPVPAVGRIRHLIEEGAELFVTEPIAMELLAGPRGRREMMLIENLVNGLPLMPLDPAIDFRSAADLYRASRSNGHPIRSQIDCVIAAVAIRHDAALLHNDRDFRFLAEISPLTLYGDDA
ncbi:MAG: PIN domain nuclease [Actinobacteria bacterium]|nr:PIN domain nuclease [Actinomycetota bacterium]